VCDNKELCKVRQSNTDCVLQFQISNRPMQKAKARTRKTATQEHNVRLQQQSAAHY